MVKVESTADRERRLRRNAQARARAAARKAATPTAARKQPAPAPDPTERRLQAGHRSELTNLHQKIGQLAAENADLKIEVMRLKAALAEHDQAVAAVKAELGDGGGWVWLAT